MLSQIGSYAQTLVWIIPAFIFVLGLVVFFHELGHFSVARWCGVKVDVFSLGFGPELFAFHDRQGTRWRCAAIPIGGYVKFHGDLNGASVPDEATLATMSPEDRQVSFFGQSVWKRAAIVAAGPLASFLFAIVVFSFIFFVNGVHITLPRVSEVKQDSAAAAAGFKPGDLVIAIDGRRVDSFGDMKAIVSLSANDRLNFDVERDGKRIVLQATPRRQMQETPFGKLMVAEIGIKPSLVPADNRQVMLGVGGAVREGVLQTWQILHDTVTFIRRLVVGRENTDQLSGPLGIASMSGKIAQFGIMSLLTWAAVLSASIGFFNLLPVPLLDGGHLLYFALEALRGRPLSLRAQEFGFRIGLALVALLMVFATSNDILKWFRT